MKSLQMLAIDLGASSGRGIVGSYDGGKLTLDEVHRFSNDPVTVCGTFRWDILRILHEIKTAIRAAGLSGFRPEGMGIDTWGVDFGLLDRHGELLANPVHYRDTRTVGIFDEVEGVLPAEYLYNLTGIQQIAFNSVYQLAAQKRDNPELLAAAEKMLFIPDLLNYFLTGKTANEYTITTTGALVNAATGKCATELFDRLGIKHLIGELAPAGGLLGGLSDAVSAELGGTKLDVYHVASHDTASAVISVPATEPDFVYISSGTWSLMGTELTSPLINGETRRLNFTNEGGALGTIRFLKNIMGLWIVQESRRQWKREGKDYSFADLQRMAEAEAPCSRLSTRTTPFSPRPAICRAAWWNTVRKRGRGCLKTRGRSCARLWKVWRFVTAPRQKELRSCAANPQPPSISSAAAPKIRSFAA